MKIRISFWRQVVAPEIRSSHAYLITKVPPNSIVIICSSTWERKGKSGLDSIIRAGRHRSMTSCPDGTNGPLTLVFLWIHQPRGGFSRWIKWIRVEQGTRREEKREGGEKEGGLRHSQRESERVKGNDNTRSERRKEAGAPHKLETRKVRPG